MANPKKAIKGAATATQKIERSKLNRAKFQREMMGGDLDLEEMVIYLKSVIQFDVVERVIDVVVERDIDAASTVKITLHDPDKTVLQSRRLHNRLDVKLDGLWFRLVKVERAPGATTLDLTFEQREIAILRTYPKKGTKHNGVIFADRTKTTRAEFIMRLIREVKEFDPPIAVVCPELHKVQEIEKQTDLANSWQLAGGTPGTTDTSADYGAGAASTGGGIPLNYNVTHTPPHGTSTDDRNTSPQRQANQQRSQLTVKGAIATKDQIRNVNTVIAVGLEMGVRPKVICTAIQVIIQESVARNIKYGDNAHGGGKGDSVGLFQQTESWGSYEDRTDPATAARQFYKEAVKLDRFEPNVENWTLAADVQRPRADLRGQYALWRKEAARFLAVYGVPLLGDDEASASLVNAMGDTSSQSGSDFLYWRGTPEEQNKIWKREDSWTCIRRLADEVGWRAFFVGGVFYFISDDDLFKTQPVMIVDEKSPGIDGIGFDLDIGKKTSECNVEARVGRWLAPPGSVILTKNVGPASGRWLVHQFSRSIFDSLADITCGRPLAQLPEPLDDNVETYPSWAPVADTSPYETPSGEPTAGATVAGVTPHGQKYMWPLDPPGDVGGGPGAGTHDYYATPNNWESDNAWDIMVPDGSKVIAVSDGTIGTSFGLLPGGEPSGGGRFAGIRLHLITKDNEFYYMHLKDTIPGLGPGSKVVQGQIIGHSGTANGIAHLHIGVKNPYNPPLKPPIPFKK